MPTPCGQEDQIAIDEKNDDVGPMSSWSGNKADQVPDEDFDVPEEKQRKVKKPRIERNNNSYPNLSSVVSRYGVSATAAIVNSALEDLGILDNSNKFDASKIRREKEKWGEKEANDQRVKLKGIQGLAFDERRDSTLIGGEKTAAVKVGRYCSKTVGRNLSFIKETHAVVLAIPGNV